MTRSNRQRNLIAARCSSCVYRCQTMHVYFSEMNGQCILKQCPQRFPDSIRNRTEMYLSVFFRNFPNYQHIFDSVLFLLYISNCRTSILIYGLVNLSLIAPPPIQSLGVGLISCSLLLFVSVGTIPRNVHAISSSAFLVPGTVTIHL